MYALSALLTVEALAIGMVCLIHEWSVKEFTRLLGEYYARREFCIPRDREPTSEEVREGIRRYGERLARRGQFLILSLHDHGCFVGKPSSICEVLRKWAVRGSISHKEGEDALVRTLKQLAAFVDTIAQKAAIPDKLADDLRAWNLDLQHWTRVVERLA